MKLDETDRRILRVMQSDAELSIRDIGEKVGLSHTPCWKRIRAMEAAGILAGRVWRVAPKALGIDLRVWCLVSLKDHEQGRLAEFERATALIPEVIGCSVLAGDDDYMLEILTRDLNSFEALMKDRILRLPGVRHVSSRIALRSILRRDWVAI